MMGFGVWKDYFWKLFSEYCIMPVLLDFRSLCITQKIPAGILLCCLFDCGCLSFPLTWEWRSHKGTRRSASIQNCCRAKHQLSQLRSRISNPLRNCKVRLCEKCTQPPLPENVFEELNDILRDLIEGEGLMKWRKTDPGLWKAPLFNPNFPRAEEPKIHLPA